MEIVKFKPEHLPLVISLARRAVDRHASDSFYRSLYCEAPSVRGLLAIEDSVCVAMIWAFRRTYRVRSTKREFLEGFDWYCLPEFRGSGVGVNLLHRFMSDFPMLTVGGSTEALALLLRMKWNHLTDASVLQLPLSGRLLAKTSSRTWAEMVGAGFATVRQWFKPRGRYRIAEGHVVAGGDFGLEVLDLYWRDHDFDGLVPIPDQPFIRWLISSAHSDVGHYLPLYFMAGRKLIGWSLSRIFESNLGTEAVIVDLFSPKSCSDCYPWIVSETSRILTAFNPTRISAKSSHPAVVHAFHQNRFISTSTMPVYTWKCPDDPNVDELFLGSACNDSPLLPYASQWLDV